MFFKIIKIHIYEHCKNPGIWDYEVLCYKKQRCQIIWHISTEELKKKRA